MTLNGNEIVGTGFPTDEGRTLAQYLLKQDGIEWDNLTIDMAKCPSTLLISAFFNAFWQEIFDERRELLDKALGLHWKLAFAFQKDNVSRWAHEFKPCVG